jgi:N,N'-diacetyllegionaminate synthase
MINHDVFFIGSREIGGNNKPFIIAEVGQAHDGSLGMAHSFIDAVADTGADAIKFQTHIAHEESTYEEQFRVSFSQQDITRFAYWKRMEFSPEQWAGLAKHAKDRGLYFLSSPFSIASVDLLNQIGMSAWKIGSGEYRSTFLLDAIIETKSPILFSTGMSNWDEIIDVVNYLKKNNTFFSLFQCTSEYPTPSNRVGLNVIREMREKFCCPVGLSDHSGAPFASLGALAQGADLIEVHVVFDRKMFGPDTISSLTLEELAFVVKARDSFFEMKTHPVDKDQVALDLVSMRNIFTRSLAPVKPLLRGTMLEPEMLMLKKPGTGIPPNQLSSIVGRKLIRDVSPDHLITMQDIE